MSRPLLGLCLAAGLTIACGADSATRSGEWPRFRGPAGDGFSATAAAPRSWSEGSPNIRWKTRIPGTGNSSPIVDAGRIYVTTAYAEASDDPSAAVGQGELERVVMGLDLASGEVLWETPLYRGPTGAIYRTSTHAVPTPATDGERLYVSFESRLAALDLDGRILWQKNFDPESVTHSRYGPAASVVLTGSAVILVRDREDSDREHPGFLVAVDKATGDEIWRHEWMDSCCSYSTPLVVERGGKEVVLHSSALEVLAYDAATGDVLWRNEHPLIQPVPSLMLEGDLLISPGTPHSKVLTVFRLTGTGAATRVEKVWDSPVAAPDIPSPILLDGTLFTVTERGIIMARDARTGDRRWRARLPGGTYQSSPVATDERIYAQSMEGTTAVVSTSADEFELLAENQLPDGSGASPALTEPCLVLRTASHLYCIDEEDEG